MNRRTLLVGAGLSAVTAVCVGWLLPGNSSGLRHGDAGDWPDYVDLSSLTDHSDLVFTGTVLGQRDIVIDRIAPGDAAVHSKVVERAYSFQVSEFIKGGQKGTTFELLVTQSASSGRASSDFKYDLPPLAVGRTYVVFARSLGRPEGYPESLGETLFTLAGEPAVATLKGDDLVCTGFIVDHDRLPKNFGHLRCDDPREQIRRCAGSAGYYKADRPVGIILRHRLGCQQAYCSIEQCDFCEA